LPRTGVARDRADHSDVAQRIDAHYVQKGSYAGVHADCICGDPEMTVEPEFGVTKCYTYPCNGKYYLACCSIVLHTGPCGVSAKRILVGFVMASFRQAKV
jgi:hypothetical protein